jgi:hypothetical protein
VPYVTNLVVEPRELPASGGVVTIRAGASDNRGISEVYATVTLPDGSIAAVPDRVPPLHARAAERLADDPPQRRSRARHRRPALRAGRRQALNQRGAAEALAESQLGG